MTFTTITLSVNDIGIEMRGEQNDIFMALTVDKRGVEWRRMKGVLIRSGVE